MSGPVSPPRWATRLLGRVLSESEWQEVRGDLAELFEHRVHTRGAFAARRWYWRQTFNHLFLVFRGRGSRRRSPRSGSGITANRALLSNTWADVRHALRRLAKAPGYATATVATIAVGIGANTAIFSLVYGVLLQPLPYDRPDELVRIYTSSPPNRWPFSVADFLTLREQQTTMTDVGAYTIRGVTYNDAAGAERALAMFVTPGVFPVLGIQSRLGRVIDAADGVPGAPRTVVLSDRFWRTRLGGDPTVVGTSIRIDGTSYLVAGVLAPDAGPIEAGAWADAAVDLLPVLQLDTPPRKGPFFLTVIGRVREDRRTALDGELRAINTRMFPVWASTYQDQSATWGAMPLHEHITGDRSVLLTVLFGAVLALLFIACLNVANLVLSRTADRGRELAVRVALGATRQRILVHVLSESVVVAAIGGALGLMIAWLALPLLTTVSAEYFPRTATIGLQAPVLVFLFAVTALSALLVGVIPAMAGNREQVTQQIRSGPANTETKGRQRVRGALVVAQFAFTLPLLLGAGLLGRSLARLQAVDPGFDPERILTLQLSLPSGTYQDRDAIRAFWSDVLPAVRAIPGVTAVGLSDGRPPGEVPSWNNFDLEDRPTPAGESQPVSPWMTVTPGFFEVIGAPLLEGRLIDERDAQGDPVVVVDRTWAHRYFPDESAVGKRMMSGGCTPDRCDWETVIGVVGDIAWAGLDDRGSGAVYGPHAQVPYRSMYLFARTTVDPLSVLPAVRDVIGSRDRALAPSDPTTVTALMAGAVQEPRYLAILVSTFSVAALVLACIGIYGVMSYYVRRHARAIGIRIALGSGQGQVRRMIVRHGMRLAAVGAVTGLALSWGLARFIRSLLFQVGVTDPVTLGASLAILSIVALIACGLPARRAATTDPVEVLREGG